MTGARLVILKIAGMAMVLLAANAAVAVPPEVVTFNAVPSNGVLNSPANAIRTATLQGGYTLGRVNFSGTLTSQHPSTFRIDARILITAPNGQQFTFQPFATGGTFTTLPFNADRFYFGAGNPAGEWAFRFYELVDDGGAAAVDALWNITVTFTNEGPQPPASTNLGQLTAAGVNLAAVPLAQGQMLWYRFELPCRASAVAATFLDIDTANSVLGGPTEHDTEIALHDAAGTLIASDDDDGPGFTSQLSFGAGTRPAIGDGAPFSGSDGPLEPGTYYLLIAGYNLNPGPYFQATTNSTHSGTISLRIGTNATAPCACPADFNIDGVITSADITAFLAVWFADVANGTTNADFNNSGATNSADITAFLSAWFAALGPGC